MSPEYKTAMEVSREAIEEFRYWQNAYRTMQIDDAEFLAAKAKYDAAMLVYDAAFSKEAARSEA